MEKLPIELQTLISIELSTRDICHLQQTCKAFYNFILGSSELWRERLRRQCGADILWSSFSGFTASELRRACTGTLRFKHLYRPGNHPTLPIPRLLPYNCENDDLESQQSEDSNNPYPGISSTFLVPGGRFLITVEQKWLRVWDLGPPGVLHEPREVIFQELNCANMDPRIADAVVADKDTVHLLIQEVHSQPTLPQSFARIDRSQYNFDDRSRFSLFHRFEIRLRDGGQYSVKEVGRLCVLRRSSIYPAICATQDGPVVAFGIGERVLIWGASDSPGASWVASTTISEDTAGVFCHQGYAFVVYSDGLQGFDLAGITHRPVGNGLVDLQDRAPDIGHIPPPLQFQTPCETDWASNFMLHKPMAKGGPLYYDIKYPLLEMDGDLLLDPYYVRFCFSFHPESPSASSLLFTKRYKAATRPCDTPHLRFALEEGVGGYIWYDRSNFGADKGNIFVSILDDNRDSDSPKRTGSTMEGLGYFSEMIARPDPNWIEVLDISVCPLSGRVVALWGRKSKEDRLVEIFDLYDCSSTT
ncbi:hypothetical protein DFP72DRAFT_1052110 [Ephemerocybe angulata]|uniref:F-box domain-containing protein n=1 Tax=Ephemerocybe angulata TaxID=980116 RepID=A0A8H6LVQ4_9AGAR|nr:hypothetical protein DFP72DRAFT_1052110 [Tulosesus angulatus]